MFEGLFGLILFLVIANVLGKLIKSATGGGGGDRQKPPPPLSEIFGKISEEISAGREAAPPGEASVPSRPAVSEVPRQPPEEPPGEVLVDYTLPEHLRESAFEAEQGEFIPPVPRLPDEEKGFLEDVWEASTGSTVPVDQTEISGDIHAESEGATEAGRRSKAARFPWNGYSGLRRAIVAAEITGPCRARARRRPGRGW